VHDQGRIKAALAELELEVVTQEATPRQLRIVARIRSQEASKAWAQRYVGQLLQGQFGATWSIDISRWYTLAGTGVAWAWRLILQAEDLEAGIEDFLRFWASMVPAKVVMEQPLIGMRNFAPKPDPRSPLGVGKGVTPTKWEP